MEYQTKATLVTHLESAAEVFIFIPPKESLQASPEPGLHGIVKVTWRGSNLAVDETEFADAVQLVG